MVQSTRKLLFNLFQSFLFCAILLIMAGCSGGTSAPTKIYEGGGTIPEIVEQPEKPAPKKGSGGAAK